MSAGFTVCAPEVDIESFRWLSAGPFVSGPLPFSDTPIKAGGRTAH